MNDKPRKFFQPKLKFDYHKSVQAKHTKITHTDNVILLEVNLEINHQTSHK